MNKNSVQYLQSIDCQLLSDKEKLEIKNDGRPTPELNFFQTSTSRNQTYVRKFNNAFYNRNQWLCGCEESKALYCFPCLLFGGDDTWTKFGVIDLKHLGEKMKKHEESAKHLKSVIDMALLGGITNDKKKLNQIQGKDINEHNQRVMKNREILSKIIDCIMFCGQYEVPVSTDAGGAGHTKPPILKGLLEFSGMLSDSLKTHFMDSNVFKGSTKNIEKDLFNCILQICHEQIINEISRSKFLSVIFEDVSNVSTQTDLVIIFRYELEGVLYERFWSFCKIDEQTAEATARCIVEQLEIVLKDNTDKLVGQTYDGAVSVSQVQSLIKQSYRFAHFIHCYAHQLKLIIDRAAASNDEARVFFCSLATIPAFFTRSPSRLAVLDSVSKRMSSGSQYLTNTNSQLVEVVLQTKEVMEECCEVLLTSRNSATVQGTAALVRMLNDDHFTYWLRFFNNIVPHVDALNRELLLDDATSGSISMAVREFTENMNKEKQQIPCVIVKEEDPSPPVAKKSKLNQNLISAMDVCDKIANQVTERFAFNKHLGAENLIHLALTQNNKSKHLISSFQLDETIEAYPFLSPDRLLTELNVVNKIDAFHTITSVTSLYRMMRNSGICEALKELTTLIQLILTIPMTTPENSRRFNTLKKAKVFVKNSSFQNHLSPLGMLSMESIMVKNMTNFNERVIHRFSTLRGRNKDFHLK